MGEILYGSLIKCNIIFSYRTNEASIAQDHVPETARTETGTKIVIKTAENMIAKGQIGVAAEAKVGTRKRAQETQVAFN